MSAATIKGSGRQYDAQYRERLSEAVTEALFNASTTDGICFIRVAELVDVLTSQMAVHLAASPEVDRTRDRRRMCDDIARKLFRQIGEARVAFERDGSPFDNVISGRFN